MDYGQTQNQLEMERRLRQPNPGTEDPFASAITPGAGLNPEDYNPDLSTSLNSNNIPVTTREDQANIGSRTMEIDTYLPGNLPENQAGLAGINDANRAKSIDDIKTTEPRVSELESEITEIVSDDQADMSTSKAQTEPQESEVEKTPKEHSEPHDIIDYGKHFTTRDIELVESVIKKSGDDISSLYELVQNTREEQQ